MKYYVTLTIEGKEPYILCMTKYEVSCEEYTELLQQFGDSIENVNPQ